ncbi:MAG: preQ(1) synthase [Acidobacteriia bacterium]|nr:preQ(1) synthase [Terriglobia bacterium]
MDYTAAHAQSGIKSKLPKIEVWPNQFPNYEITIVNTEYTSVCPKTGLPDHGTITIHYVPHKHCVELKSLREYFLAYRNLGIFYENAINKILGDVVAACKPRRARVRGEFTTRGGMHSIVEASFPRPTSTRKPL